MHEALKPLEELHPLHDPVLIAAFSGWGDMSGSALATVDYLTEQWDARPIAEIDPEPFYDFTVQRPRVRPRRRRANDRLARHPLLRRARPGGGARLRALPQPGAQPPLAYVHRGDRRADGGAGRDDQHHARAQPAAVPHTRPTPVTLSASHPDFEEQFGLKAPPGSRYQGPVGIVSVLNLDHRARQWRNAHLRAMAPHYLTIGPNPNVAAALLKTLDRGLQTSTPLGPLDERVDAFEQQVREVIAQSSEAEGYVRQLEQQYDENQPAAPPFEQEGAQGAETELPATDDILSDLERFLRDRRSEDS